MLRWRRPIHQFPWQTLTVFTLNGRASIGPDHQVSSRLNRPAVATAASAPTPNLAASQRVRVMVWVQASRLVGSHHTLRPALRLPGLIQAVSLVCQRSFLIDLSFSSTAPRSDHCHLAVADRAQKPGLVARAPRSRCCRHPSGMVAGEHDGVTARVRNPGTRHRPRRHRSAGEGLAHGAGQAARRPAREPQRPGPRPRPGRGG